MIERYDLTDSTGTHARVQQRFARTLLEIDFSDLPDGANVLEIGPGIGHFARACLNRGLTYRAIEGSRVLRDRLSEAGIEAAGGEVPPIPEQNDQFDLVFAGMVFEHMPDHPTATRFVNEIVRVLKSGGRCCLLFPNAHACGRLFYEMDHTHGYFATPRRAEQMCRQAGLDLIRSDRTIGWFWVKSRPHHHLVRFASNACMTVANWHLVTSAFDMLGLEGPLWKIRKTFFEAALLVLRKT